MSKVEDLHQRATAFGPFLYASVGEDRNGSSVTVLSTLARLGMEPWTVAADLASLRLDEARTRLDGILDRFVDVPALRVDHRAVSRQLVDLLPMASRKTDHANDDMSGIPQGVFAASLVVGGVMIILLIGQTILL